MSGIWSQAEAKRFNFEPLQLDWLSDTKLPLQWIPGVFSPMSKACLGQDTDHFSPSSAKVKNEEKLYLLCCTQAPSQCLPGTSLLVLQNFLIHMACIDQCFKQLRDSASALKLCSVPLDIVSLLEKITFFVPY